MIHTICPNCGRKFELADETAGRRARCKDCNTRFVVRDGLGEPLKSETASPQANLSTDPQPAASTTNEDQVPPIWNIGDVILDLYEVKEIHQGGGMGLVYRVHHKQWDIDLAVKSPRPEFFKTERHKQNFERECETWVNLGLHPHIVSCYYVRRLGGIPRVFAEYVEGGDLASWIRDGRLYEGGHKASLKRILDIAIQFAWGLHYAHEQGLIHQDVKPANLMLLPDGTAKVSDFGLARARGVVGESAASADPHRSILVSSGGMTPAYCSPEQATKQPLSRKTDIWSWALSMLEMFTGEVTWRSGTLAQGELERCLREGAEDESVPPMPVVLADLLRVCFRFKQEERPATMLEVATCLQQTHLQLCGKYLRTQARSAKARSDTLNNRAASLYDLGRQGEAQKILQESHDIDPQHLQTVYNLGLLGWRSGRASDTHLLELLRAAGETNPTNQGTILLTAQVHLERGDNKAALELLTALPPAERQREDLRALYSLAVEPKAGTGRLIRDMRAHCKEPDTGASPAFPALSEGISVSMSSDGRYILSGRDDSASLLDAATGKCIATFEDTFVDCVYLSPDGRFAFLGGTLGITMWDVASSRQVRSFKVNHVKLIRITSDRELLIAQTTFGVESWRLSNGNHAAHFCDDGFLGGLAISNKDNVVVTVSDEGIKTWDPASGKCLTQAPLHLFGTTCISLSPDSRRVLTAGYGSVIDLWDIGSGRRLLTLAGHTECVTSARLSSDGQHCLSGGWDRTVRVWDLRTGQVLRTMGGHSDPVTSVDCDHAFRIAVSGSLDGTIKLWTLELDKPRYKAPLAIVKPISSDRERAIEIEYQGHMDHAKRALAHGDFRTALNSCSAARAAPGCGRRPEATALWQRLYAHLPLANLQAAWMSGSLEDNDHGHLVLSADGRLALAAHLGRLDVWDLPNRKKVRSIKIEGGYRNSMNVSVDGRYAVEGAAALGRFSGATSERANDTGVVQVWDTQSGASLWRRDYEGIYSVCFSNDGRWVVAGSSRHAILFDARSGMSECGSTFYIGTFGRSASRRIRNNSLPEPLMARSGYGMCHPGPNCGCSKVVRKSVVCMHLQMGQAF